MISPDPHVKETIEALGNLDPILDLAKHGYPEISDEAELKYPNKEERFEVIQRAMSVVQKPRHLDTQPKELKEQIKKVTKVNLRETLVTSYGYFILADQDLPGQIGIGENMHSCDYSIIAFAKAIVVVSKRFQTEDAIKALYAFFSKTVKEAASSSYLTVNTYIKLMDVSPANYFTKEIIAAMKECIGGIKNDISGKDSE